MESFTASMHILIVSETEPTILIRRLIRRNFRDIGPAAFVLIYKHFMRSHLEYNKLTLSGHLTGNRI